MRVLRPRTKVGRTTLWFGGFSVLFIALRWVAGSASGSKLSGWRRSLPLFSHSVPSGLPSAGRGGTFIGVIPIVLYLLSASISCRPEWTDVPRRQANRKT
jgi:hypothetical protein